MSIGTTQMNPEQTARAAVEAVLHTQWEGLPVVRLDSPPGAGKTWVVENLAAQAQGIMGERCMISTQTNDQAFDVARRLATRFPRLRTHLFVRDGLPVPPQLSVPNLTIVTSGANLPVGPCIVVANSAKWSWVQEPAPQFDLLVVDEAFQLADYRFQQIAGLSRRIVLVGDPGQIPPVVTCEIERWKCDAAGPHVACPKALCERYPSVTRLSLPISRRLVADTVSFVQPAFYPELPFGALTSARLLRVTLPISRKPGDAALDLVVNGASLVLSQLPPAITGEVDDELADAIVGTVTRLFERGATVHENGTTFMLDPRMVGIVFAHVSQVNAIRERLPRQLNDVLVETSDRFQGLQREVMLVHHPLSGRADASTFHLDAGRLCVMMSRHRIACMLVTRAGIRDRLMRHAPSGDRILGIPDDPEYTGWRAHLRILDDLRGANRIVDFV